MGALTSRATPAELGRGRSAVFSTPTPRVCQAACMSMKVKRGLGLLLVAVITFLALNVTVRLTDGLATRGTVAEVAGWSLFVVSLLLVVAMLVSVVVGLVMIAWGLLRD